MTRLLPTVFADLDYSRRLNVLDLSAATAESVRFFSRFRCRLHFADLLGDTGYQAKRREPRQAHETRLDSVLGVPKNVQFDICLFWDLLNCMDVDLLRDLAQTLTSHVHSETRLHAFVAFSKTQPFHGHRFGLADVDRLTAKAKPLPTPFRHTHKDIVRALWPFSVRNATLLGDNRQELFMMPDPLGLERLSTLSV